MYIYRIRYKTAYLGVDGYCVMFCASLRMTNVSANPLHADGKTVGSEAGIHGPHAQFDLPEEPNPATRFPCFLGGCFPAWHPRDDRSLRCLVSPCPRCLLVVFVLGALGVTQYMHILDYGGGVMLSMQVRVCVLPVFMYAEGATFREGFTTRRHNRETSGNCFGLRSFSCQ